jgi:hypothetical protein
MRDRSVTARKSVPVNVNSFLRKHRLEAAIIAGFVVLLLGGVVYPMVRSGDEPVQSATLQRDVPHAAPALHGPPPLAGIGEDLGQAPLSLDVALQGGKKVVLAGATAPVELNFSRNRTISFVGWAADRTVPAAGVYLVINGRRVPAQYGLDRPDVAQALSAPDARYVGFIVNVPPNLLAVGANKLGVEVVDSTAKGYYAELPQATIVLKK